ncbi:MAG: acyl-CoA dehydratase activase [Synergistaceae bacterium]|jgi:predicted CoA-substrate-specific enzyme activase|nr:acyl-CoA dehydratase activase [Synergistaceae bacterium]
MTKWFVGIDSGSALCKTALFDGKGVTDALAVKTGWNPGLSAAESLGCILKRNSLSRGDVCVSSTGYGREAIDFADCSFTEITCHAFGGMNLAPGIEGVIDIGGQDSKVIQIEGGRVTNFMMNDKCAAGTGRFLNMSCERLGLRLEDIDEFADPDEAIPVNNMCAVFAESEIIGLLAMQKDRSKIMTGVLQSIAQKIRQMTGKVGFTGTAPLLMTGGLSKSALLIRIIAQAISLDVITHELALFAGAVGACVCAGDKGRW